MANLIEPKFFDVFSGCGGISVGLMASGWKGLFAIEKNDHAFQTLKHNLISGNGRYKFDWPDWLSQSSMTVADLLHNHKTDLISMRGNVDLIAGGPPCQGFSSAGKRDPMDPRNTLTEEYIEVVSLVRPRILLIENVRGFNEVFKAKGKSGEKKPYALIVRERLEKLGYQVYSSLICCSQFGVPQLRKRYIMIAVMKGDTILNVLNGHDPIERLLIRTKDFRRKKGLPVNRNISALDAISDLETSKYGLIDHNGEIKGFKQINYSAPEYHERTSYQKLMRKGMRNKKLTSLRLARHTEPVIGKFKQIQKIANLGRCLTPADRLALGIKKHSITPLHPKLPSPTVTTLPDDILHYSEPRILTVRENARLQSFPDWFEFKGKYTTGGKQRKLDCPRYTQVGNAVPPLLSEAIGEMLKGLIDQARLMRNKKAIVTIPTIDTCPDPLNPETPQPAPVVAPDPCP